MLWLALVGIAVSQVPSTAVPMEVLAARAADGTDAWAVIEVPIAGEVLADPEAKTSPLPPLAVEVVVGGGGGEAANGSGRILYPVSDEVRLAVLPPSEQPVPRPGGGRLLGRLRNLVREISGDAEAPVQVVARRVSFLIPGGDPIRVAVSDAGGVIGVVDVSPVNSSAAADKLRGDWWAAITDAAETQIAGSSLPPKMETYLIAMLAGRYSLPLPDWYLPPVADDSLWDTLKLIGGSGEIEDRMFRRVAAGIGVDRSGAARLPLPPPPNWLPDVAPKPMAAVDIEPIARFIPPECFYLRFGSFENFLWFQNLTERSGGDVARLVTIGGVARDASARLQRQLNLQTNELSKQLGPSVIEDQAIIGTDLYLNDGSSMGVLIRAKQPFLLRTSLSGDRSRLAREDPSITLEPFDQFEPGDLSAADVDVSGVTLLSGGDGAVRSFMAERRGVFFNTNSRHLMGRFLSVASGDRALSDTAAFRYGRTLMPTSRGDTVFVYVSPEMIRHLVSPRSMIELRRRLITSSEMSMVHLARLANRQEGYAAVQGIDPLRRTGFLPTTFGNRPDGTGLIDVDGELVIDSMRGRSGVLLPIADVTIEAVTAEESDWYRDIAAAYSTRYASVDPIMVGIQRRVVDDRVDQGGGDELTIHAEVAPFSPENYGKWGSYLGPPTDVAITFAPDDIAAVSAHVASDQLGPPTHLFAAVKDAPPPNPEDFEGLLNIYRSLKVVPGYIGAYPRPGVLDRLPLGLGIGTPVSPTLNRLIGGVYRFTDGPMSVLSFDPTIIDGSIPYITAAPSTVPAQVRASVGDLHGSQLGPWINEQIYRSAAETSLAGATFLSSLSRQFSLSPVQAAESAGKILGGRVQCSLGGQYVFDSRSGRFISTVWGGGVPPPLPPAGWVAPPLRWFSGASAAVLQQADRLTVDAVVRMDMPSLPQ